MIKQFLREHPVSKRIFEIEQRTVFKIRLLFLALTKLLIWSGRKLKFMLCQKCTRSLSGVAQQLGFSMQLEYLKPPVLP
jgi:hypothetical protein